MKKLKVLSLVAVSAFIGASALTLSSCGPTAVLSDADINPILPEGDPTSEVTVSFWHSMGHNRTTQVERIVEEFNEQYKGKYKVVLDQVAGTYDDLDDAVRTRLAGGEVPALTMAYPDSISQYITSDRYMSSVYQVDNYIADPEFGYSQDELDDFVDEFLDEGRNYQFEGTWSMPFYKSTEIMYYNENYFSGDNLQNSAKFKGNGEFEAKRAVVSAAGAKATDKQLGDLRKWVEDHDGYTYDVPTTWDEMVALGRQMIADRQAENVTGEFYPVGYDSDANLMISQLAQRDIPYTTNQPEGGDLANQFLFNNEQTETFLTELTGLIREKVLVTGNTSGVNYTNTLFTDLRTAMTIGSTGGSSYNVSSNFRVSLAPVPYANGQQLYIMQGPSICFFIQNDPYVQKGAWLFYKAMAETENNVTMALESSYDPVRESCFETQTYIDWIAKADLDLKYAIPNATKDLRDKYITSDVFIGSDVARDQMDEIIAQVVNSNYSPKEALQNAYNACRAAVL